MTKLTIKTAMEFNFYKRGCLLAKAVERGEVVPKRAHC